MQAIMETVFEIPYLLGVVALGILTLRAAKGRRQFTVYGIMAIVLGCGDAFHLVPRMYALWTDGIANHTAALGAGKLVTSITMTVFYLLLYHVWRERYNITKTPPLTAAVYLLAAARAALCLFPQNRWMYADAPLLWGVLRNLPFAALGIVIIVLFYRSARASRDRPFRFIWLAVSLSFAFYIPVVLWADALAPLGMLMIPKTCAYVWIVWLGYSDARGRQKE